MDLDSARTLKAELGADLAGPGALVARGRLPLDVSARASATLSPLHPTVALGIAPAAPGDYRLAVRVQRRSAVDGPEVRRIREAAREEVDVRYVGRVAKLEAPSPPSPPARQRPLRIGGSVGHYAITAGSIGLFLRRPGAPGELLLLSNNHVLANEGRARVGDEILQPGPADGGRRGADAVGVLDAFVALSRTAPNLVDAAVAALDPEVEADLRTLDGLGELTGIGEAADAGAVAKVGRTTGLTFGGVSAFEVDNVVVAYEAGSLRFDDQVEISGGADGAFSQGGDSGSAIVTRDGLEAVGLLFAGSDQGGSGGFGVTYANPLGTVLARLGAELAR